MNVSVYTTPTCGYCHQVKSFLSQRGVPFTEYDVSRDRTAAGDMVRLTGQMGVPVIVVNGEVVIGFDRPRLEQLLSQTGRRQHPHLGLKVADASRAARKAGMTPLSGALIGAVAPSSPGEKAGLLKGDIITEANQRRVNNADDMERALANLTYGDRVKIVFQRGQQTAKAEIVI